jgi:hypothetical protein
MAAAVSPHQPQQLIKSPSPRIEKETITAHAYQFPVFKSRGHYIAGDATYKWEVFVPSRNLFFNETLVHNIRFGDNPKKFFWELLFHQKFKFQKS